MAQKLKQITSDIRRNEKEHFLKVQEIHGEESVMNNKEKENFLDDEGDMTMLEQEEGDLSYRV